MQVVASFYRFVHLPDFVEWREPLLQEMLRQGIKGTILLAEEGLNGTVCGSRQGIDALMHWLTADGRLQAMACKESLVQSDAKPFYRTRVKFRRELVALGVEGVDPARSTGVQVSAGDWNRLISDPQITLIDTRNQYEVALGSFAGALDPDTHSFREFPDFVRRRLDPHRHRQVAMFCTGGIRCEKATAYLLQQGFEEVYQLQGGILQYLEEIPEGENLFEGECFVFDHRVSVDADLQPGSCEQCYACRRPLSPADRAAPEYAPGLSCPYCYGSRSPEKLAGLGERHRQVALAASREESHLGGE